MSPTKLVNTISPSTTREGHHSSLLSTWTMSRWLQHFTCGYPASSLSTERSIHQIQVPPVQRPGCHAERCRTLHTSPSRCCRWLCPIHPCCSPAIAGASRKGGIRHQEGGPAVQTQPFYWSDVLPLNHYCLDDWSERDCPCGSLGRGGALGESCPFLFFYWLAVMSITAILTAYWPAAARRRCRRGGGADTGPGAQVREPAAAGEWERRCLPSALAPLPLTSRFLPGPTCLSPRPRGAAACGPAGRARLSPPHPSLTLGLWSSPRTRACRVLSAGFCGREGIPGTDIGLGWWAAATPGWSVIGKLLVAPAIRHFTHGPAGCLWPRLWLPGEKQFNHLHLPNQYLVCLM